MLAVAFCWVHLCRPAVLIPGADGTDDLYTLSTSQLVAYAADLGRKTGFSQLWCKSENKSYDNDDDDIFEWHHRKKTSFSSSPTRIL